MAFQVVLKSLPWNWEHQRTAATTTLFIKTLNFFKYNRFFLRDNNKNHFLRQFYVTTCICGQMGKPEVKSNVFLIMLNFIFTFRFSHLEHANDYKNLPACTQRFRYYYLFQNSPLIWDYRYIPEYAQFYLVLGLSYIIFFSGFLTPGSSFSSLSHGPKVGKCSVFVRSHYFLSSLNKRNVLWPLIFLTNFLPL